MSNWLTNIINNTDLRDIISLQVPPHKRQVKRLALLHTFAKPLTELYATFNAYRNQVLYEINFDSSTIHFEKLLNDKFNNGGTGITIITNETENPVFIPGLEYGGDPVYVTDLAHADDPLMVAGKAWYDSKPNFTVNIPAALYATLDLNEVKAFVNKYKYGGFSYNIVSM
jgi:hypothetical protein